MITVSIIGSGNVAQHLILAFKNASEINLVEVYARDKKSVEHLLDSHQIVTYIEDLKAVDICIIAVSDGAIASVSQSLPFQNTLVAHTSGSIPITELSNKTGRQFSIHYRLFLKTNRLILAGFQFALKAKTKKI